MSHFYRVNGTFRPNFLESEVGLVLKTYQIPNTMGVADEYGNKIVAAGTVYPSNDASAVGIVFTDVDVTHGDHEGSVMLAGRVLKELLDVQSAAETHLKASGIVFVDAPEVSRGYTVTYEKDDGMKPALWTTTSKLTRAGYTGGLFSLLIQRLETVYSHRSSESATRRPRESR